LQQYAYFEQNLLNRIKSTDLKRQEANYALQKVRLLEAQ